MKRLGSASLEAVKKNLTPELIKNSTLSFPSLSLEAVNLALMFSAMKGQYQKWEQYQK